MSKQRAQAQQAAVAQQQAQQQAQQAAQNAAYANMQMNQYPAQTPHTQAPNMYNNMYSPNHQGAPPPYPAQPGYNQQMGMMQPQQQQRQYNQPQNLYAQATTRAGRQRASTMDQQVQSGIPPALQRVISHLDPNAPIRLQPSPAYYPPPPDGAPEAAGNGQRRRGSRAQGQSQRNFVRTLEDRTLEEGFMSGHGWQ